MKLWNYIYQFLNEHIFVANGENANLVVNVGNDQTLTIATWLCTITTIICLVLIVVFLVLFIRWLFRLTSGLIQGK